MHDPHSTVVRGPALIDPRGPRLGAWVTSVVLAVVLLTSSPWLLAAQSAVFAFGAAGRSPYGPLWRRVRRTPPAELEDARPPRFAQVVGLVFALLGLAGTGTVLLTVATALALVAALLNAAFGICLGCELYLAWQRVTTRHTPSPSPSRTTDQGALS